MRINKVILSSLFLTLLFVGSPSFATLKYQQEYTISTFSSDQDTQESTVEFLLAAKGDPNLKVVDIKYTQEKISDDCISYNAILTCHVSEPDKDFARIDEKILQNNKNYIRGNTFQ